MKFIFRSHPTERDDRGEITAFGVHFPRNVAVEVTDEHAIRKLLNNTHFEVVHEASDFDIAEDEIDPAPAPKKRGRKPKGQEAN